jgi:hypothetical protein
MPMSTFTIFDNTGMPYNVSAVTTNTLFDPEKYKAYSPMYVSTVLAMYWAVAFAGFTSIIVHTFRMSSLMCHIYVHVLTRLLFQSGSDVTSRGVSDAR